MKDVTSFRKGRCRTTPLVDGCGTIWCAIQQVESFDMLDEMVTSREHPLALRFAEAFLVTVSSEVGSELDHPCIGRAQVTRFPFAEATIRWRELARRTFGAATDPQMLRDMFGFLVSGPRILV